MPHSAFGSEAGAACLEAYTLLVCTDLHNRRRLVRMDTCPACLRAKSLLYENLFATLFAPVSVCCGRRLEVRWWSVIDERRLCQSPGEQGSDPLAEVVVTILDLVSPRILL